MLLYLGAFGFYIFKKFEENKASFLEYTPEQEISDEQFRNTIVKLFFKEINSNNLRTEARSVDAKELISNPYLALMKLLIEGPSDDTLEKTVPEGTLVNNAILAGDTVVLDLSEAFVANHPGGTEAENATIYSIVNTLTELNEVNSVKILIDGKENLGFNDNGIIFDNAFVRK